MDYNLKNESTTIVFYRYRPKGHPGSSRETSNKQELILKSLEPATDYVINVRAVNGKSRGDWSASVNVKTMSRKKPDGIYTCYKPNCKTLTETITNKLTGNKARSVILPNIVYCNCLCLLMCCFFVLFGFSFYFHLVNTTINVLNTPTVKVIVYWVVNGYQNCTVYGVKRISFFSLFWCRMIVLFLRFFLLCFFLFISTFVYGTSRSISLGLFAVSD